MSIKRQVYVILLFVLVSTITGCVGTLAKSNSYQITHNRGIPKPSNGNAVVCVYRIWRFANGGATFYIFKDDKIVGVSHRGTYFCHETSPGEYSYYVEWGGVNEKITTSIMIRAKVNKQYFISFLADAAEMREVSKSLAQKEMKDLEYTEYLPPIIPK